MALVNGVRHCPALLLSAPASGQGKTTLVAALARYHRNQGRKVRVFKTGPDFLDPMILQRASGSPVHPLDLWMVGDAACRELLYQAAGEADLILVEGVMGLFDGNPSSADLAQRFGLPVAAVIDAGAMAQTFGALAHGLANYRPALPFAGVIANRVASEGHGNMLQESLSEQTPWLAGISRNPDITLPERHLGLHQAGGIADLEQRLEVAAEMIGQTPLSQLPSPVAFAEPEQREQPPRLLEGRCIAVARDEAFAFLYHANLDLLENMGASISYFSPLKDAVLPDCDALYLPGGYPELHLQTLANNTAMLEAIRQHHSAGKPLVAECGGMLYLLESLAGMDGTHLPLAGIIPATASMRERLAGLGMQGAQFANGELRGHTFHYSAFDDAPPMHSHGIRHPSGAEGEGVYRDGNLTASYIHWYLPSNPRAAAALFGVTSA